MRAGSRLLGRAFDRLGDPARQNARRNSASAGQPRAPIAAGAEWVCVAEISIRSVGMPVFSRASSLARSSSSRGIMQLSTTTIASRVDPSSRTRHLARIGSLSLLALFCRNPPLTSTGNCVGATSMVQAPARNSRLSGGRVAAGAVGWSDGHAANRDQQQKNERDEYTWHGHFGQGRLSIWLDEGAHDLEEPLVPVNQSAIQFRMERNDPQGQPGTASGPPLQLRRELDIGPADG